MNYKLELKILKVSFDFLILFSQYSLSLLIVRFVCSEFFIEIIMPICNFVITFYHKIIEITFWTKNVTSTIYQDKICAKLTLVIGTLINENTDLAADIPNTQMIQQCR